MVNVIINDFQMTAVINYKMLEYERTDISQGIDVDLSNKSKECMLCHY